MWEEMRWWRGPDAKAGGVCSSRSFRKGSMHLSRVMGHWEHLKCVGQGADRPRVYFECPLAVVHMEKALKEKSSKAGRPGRGWCRKEGEKWGASDPGQRKGWL